MSNEQTPASALCEESSGVLRTPAAAVAQQAVTKFPTAAGRAALENIHIKIVYKIHKIARLRAAGHTDTYIKTVLGLSAYGFDRIVKLPGYKVIEQEVLSGTVESLNEALGKNQELFEEHFASGVPEAAQALLDVVRQKQDLRARIAASCEVLDRFPNSSMVHPRFASASTLGSTMLPQQVMRVVNNDMKSIGTVDMATAQSAAKEMLAPGQDI